MDWSQVSLEGPDPHLPPNQHSFQASNAAQVRLSQVKYLSCYPGPFLWTLGILIVCSIAAWFVHWSFEIPAVIVLVLFLFVLYRNTQRAIFGDVCPGIVVNLDPCLVAFSTDLLTDPTRLRPALQVYEEPLHRALGRPPVLGERVPVITVYGTLTEQGYWACLMPFAAACCTNDAFTLQRLLQSIPAQEWELLTAKLARAPRPLFPGLYRVIVPTEPGHVESSQTRELTQLLAMRLATRPVPGGAPMLGRAAAYLEMISLAEPDNVFGVIGAMLVFPFTLLAFFWFPGLRTPPAATGYVVGMFAVLIALGLVLDKFHFRNWVAETLVPQSQYLKVDFRAVAAALSVITEHDQMVDPAIRKLAAQAKVFASCAEDAAPLG